MILGLLGLHEVQGIDDCSFGNFHVTAALDVPFRFLATLLILRLNVGRRICSFPQAQKRGTHDY